MNKDVIVTEKRKQLEQTIISTYSMYQKNNLSMDELKYLVFVLVDYCKMIKYPNINLPTPQTQFLLIRDALAEYDNINNQINVSINYLEDILNKNVYSLRDLYSTIGHEMMHYYQNAVSIEYEKLSPQQQISIDEGLKQTIFAYKNYYKYNEIEIEVLHDLLAPFLKEKEKPIGYRTLEDYYKDISYASYFSIRSEQEARESGYDFSLSIFNLMNDKLINDYRKTFSLLFFNRKNQKSKLLEYDKSKIFSEKRYVSNEYKINLYKMQVFSNNYSADEDKILKIVSKYESENMFDNYSTNFIFAYKRALAFLISDKTLEQRMSLLKNAIFNGYCEFSKILIDSMSNDINFVQNKNQISRFLHDCFTGKEYGKGAIRFPKDVYKINFSPLLNKIDFDDIINNNESYNMTYMVDFVTANSYAFYSIESFSKYQELALKNIISPGTFFVETFKSLSIEQKVELLFSNQVNQNFIRTLIKSIMTDNNYDSVSTTVEQFLNITPLTDFLQIVKEDPQNLDIIPKKYQTQEMWNIFAEKYVLAVVFNGIPKGFQKQKMWLDAIRVDAWAVANNINNIPPNLIDEEFLQEVPTFIANECRRILTEQSYNEYDKTKISYNKYQMGE